MAVGGLTGLPIPAAAAEEAQRTGVLIREGTNMCAAVSPDGSTVVIDVLGMLFAVPISGGDARPLIDELADATQPDWAPDGRSIVFQSYRTGNFHLWLIDADGGHPRQLTTGPFDHREPRFSPDGKRVAFSSDLGGSYGIHVLDLASGKITAWADGPADEAAPAWSPDGTTLAFTVDTTAIDAVDETGNRRRLVEPKGGLLYAPFWLPGGTGIGYVRFEGEPQLPGPTSLIVGDRAVTGPAEDVFPFRAAWLSATEILYTADGKLVRRDLGSGQTKTVPFAVRAQVTPRRPRHSADVTRPGARPVRGIVGPALSPDAKQVAFCALGDLWLQRIGGNPERLTHDGFLTTDPAWSPDGRFLAYTSDRTGNPDLWLRDLRDGSERRLTALSYAAVAPAWSPDGARIAFQDQDGATYLLTVAGGSVQKVLDALWEPGRPTWSPDGTVLAFAAVKPYSKRFREGTNQILTLDLRTGTVIYHEPAAHRSLSTRGYDGPVWSPDGTKMAFVMGSALWVLPVDVTGKPTGAARRITQEVTDAPTWSGDSTRLLYLSNGRLRLVKASGGTAKTLPVQLTAAPAVVAGRTVIHAGRLWDGVSRRLRENVDIVVAAGRIAEVRPHVAGQAVVDASHLTVLPGLADMHVHAHMKGRFLGARQGPLWLSFGVTTIRSPGDPVYQALQEREAVSAGSRLGPRYFGTGEAIDGSRVYYNFMRPTTTDEELNREIERAIALDYDLVKAYVRLPWSSQRTVADAAHRDGKWVTSHYLYPAAKLGLDGMEHMGATNRLGYSQTSSRRGFGYGDVVGLFGATGMSITPTLFQSSVLLAKDPSLVTDKRVTTLYPAWEYLLLQQKLAQVTSSPAVTQLLEQALAANAGTAKRIQESGGLVIAGTDSPIDHPAISLHLNLRALVANGMSPYDALRTATANAAIVLGAQDSLGSVAPGRLADLSFVEGDPLSDITAAAAVRKVMAAGVLHDVDDLLKPFARTQAGTPNAVLPALHSHAKETYWWHAAAASGEHRSCCG